MARAESDPFRRPVSTPVLVTVGESDFRVPLNNTLEYWSALQRMQVPSRLIVFPDENHWILKGENSRLFYAELERVAGALAGPHRLRTKIVRRVGFLLCAHQ